MSASDRSGSRLDELFAALSREPDFDAPELRAYDATDRLLLDTAADEIRALGSGELVVIGDRHGALTLGAIFGLGAQSVRTHQDGLLGERALMRNWQRLQGATGEEPLAPSGPAFTSLPLDATLLEGAHVVLVQLPRSLDALDEIAAAIARFTAPDVRVYAGGRVKHMTTRMNDVLRRSFTSVTAGLARQKSRVLTASGPVQVGRGDGGVRVGAQTGSQGDSAGSASSGERFPVWGDDPDLTFRLAAYGQTFGGATLDHGSRLLLATLEARWPEARRIVDLGCGNGVLAVSAALACPTAAVIATDQSAAAVAATRLTVRAAGVESRVAVHRADATEAVPDAWADLLLLNPPFHAGAAVHTGVAHRLIRSCGRALAPGGELRLVFNSSLRYRDLVERTIGPTQELARDRTFTVLSATRR